MPFSSPWSSSRWLTAGARMSATVSFFLLESERDTTPPAESNPGKAAVSCQIICPAPYKASNHRSGPLSRLDARFSNPSRHFLQGWDPAETRSSPVLSVLAQAAPNPLVSSPFSPLSSCGRGSSFGGRSREWEVAGELHGCGNGAPPRRSRGAAVRPLLFPLERIVAVESQIEGRD